MPKRSFLVRFSSDAERDAFAQRLRAYGPELRSSVYFSKQRPEAVVNIRPTFVEVLLRLIGSDGRVFDDIEFKAMDSSTVEQG
jgi:hypothetical protein